MPKQYLDEARLVSGESHPTRHYSGTKVVQQNVESWHQLPKKLYSAGSFMFNVNSRLFMLTELYKAEVLSGC